MPLTPFWTPAMKSCRTRSAYASLFQLAVESIYVEPQLLGVAEQVL